MDWFEGLQSKMWAFPRGMWRDGGAGAGSLKWTSKYGSVVTSIYDIASSDGMNEAGLVANMLYLAESDYGEKQRAGQARISVGAWLQHVLDNFATVRQAVAAWRSDKLCVVAPDLPNGKKSGVHLSLSDEHNNSAILEFVDGKLVIHEGPEFRVMTNSPSYDRQLAITAYWEEIGGISFLPGTHRAADRFARLHYNLKSVPKVSTDRLAVATVMSLMRHVSVPLGIVDPEKPNLASTLWRTVSDHGNRRYVFEAVTSPTVFWVDLDKVNLSKGAPVMCLDGLEDDSLLAGEVSGHFQPAKPFAFAKAGPSGNIEL